MLKIFLRWFLATDPLGHSNCQRVSCSADKGKGVGAPRRKNIERSVRGTIRLATYYQALRIWRLERTAAMNTCTLAFRATDSSSSAIKTPRRTKETRPFPIRFTEDELSFLRQKVGSRLRWFLGRRPGRQWSRIQRKWSLYSKSAIMLLKLPF